LRPGSIHALKALELLDSTTGARAVPGSQQPQTPEAFHTDGLVPVPADALRAGDGSRSGLSARWTGLVVLSKCARNELFEDFILDTMLTQFIM